MKKPNWTPEQRAEWTEAKLDKIRAARTMLEDGIARLTSSEQWQRWLAFQAQFHDYSFHNTVLIPSQCPNATQVMGFQGWKAVGRSVKKGEKGIAIFAPRFKKKDDDETQRELAGYAVVHVFDVSQTEGDPLPSTVTEIRGTSETIRSVRAALEALLARQEYPVEIADLKEGVYGQLHPAEHKIVLRPDLDDVQTVATLAHESAHALLHVPARPGLTRSVAELEAESVAYVVLQHYGIDTGEFSFGYVAGWKPDPIALKESGARIQDAAATLIDGIDASTETRDELPLQRSLPFA